MADQSVSTVLSLSLHPSPGISHSREEKPRVDLCPSIWCFNPIKSDQEPSVSAIPKLQESTFTLLSPSTHSKPSSVLDPSMKRKRQKISDLKPNMTKKQRVEEPPPGLKGNEQWIKKRLSLSDVNDSSRLLLPKEEIKNYILPLMDEERRATCQSTEGLRVKMWDVDTVSEHELSLKQWKTGSFLLTSNRCMEFVKRRNLQEGDCIGPLWDSENLGFFFHKFNTQS